MRQSETRRRFDPRGDGEMCYAWDVSPTRGSAKCNAPMWALRRVVASFFSALLGYVVSAHVLWAGTWTPLTNAPPEGIGHMLLLTDGTVMGWGYFSDTSSYDWYRLTPDVHGSYVNGTWNNLASMHDSRDFFATQVLPDGRVFVAGAEYGSGSATAEIYDPTTNIWTYVSPPSNLLDPTQLSPNFSASANDHQAFFDSVSTLLSNGTVLIAPVFGSTYGQTLIYQPGSNIWSAGPTLANSVLYQDEASWVMLADQSILTIDPFGFNSNVTGNAPAAIAGLKFLSIYGSSSPHAGAGGLTGNVVYGVPNDGSPEQGTGPYTPYSNAAQLNGNICFVDRGNNVTFATKIGRAAASGAIACIVDNFNNPGKDPVVMAGLNGFDNIPAAMISRTDRDTINSAAGGFDATTGLPLHTVNVTIKNDGTAHSERYVPSLNQWLPDATVPFSLYDPIGGELGAAFVLPSGQAFFLGSTGHTGLYVPSGNTTPGTWIAGPDIPNSLGTPDAAAAMMANGRILCAVSPQITSTDSNGNAIFPSPTYFCEYDPVANSFALVNAPVGQSESYASFLTAMLDLPDGTVLYADRSTQLYVYTPDGSPLASGKPTISGIYQNADGSYYLRGALLNGISQGAAYGDNWQMASNYPVIRFIAANGNVYYARTYNWSSSAVMTGSTPEWTQFTLPAGFSVPGQSFIVSANGISSDPFPVSTVITLFAYENNDNFANARPLSGSVGDDYDNNVTATRESGEPVIDNNPGGGSVWYSWTAPATGVVAFDANLDSFDSILAAYTGNNLNTLTQVASDQGPGQRYLNFRAVQGTTYYLAIDGFNGGAGNIHLRWAQPPTTMTSITRLSNGQVVLLGRGVPNQSFDVQASTALGAQAQPTTIGTATSAANGVIQYQDMNASSFTRRFYEFSLP